MSSRGLRLPDARSSCSCRWGRRRRPCGGEMPRLPSRERKRRWRARFGQGHWGPWHRGTAGRCSRRCREGLFVGKEVVDSYWLARFHPSPGTPGEGRQGALLKDVARVSPLPSPPPDYRGREKREAVSQRHAPSLICLRHLHLRGFAASLEKRVTVNDSVDHA